MSIIEVLMMYGAFCQFMFLFAISDWLDAFWSWYHQNKLKRMEGIRHEDR
jgi:hypothetical protein